MNGWDQRETRVLIERLRAEGRVTAQGAVELADLVDDGRENLALNLMVVSLTP